MIALLSEWAWLKPSFEHGERLWLLLLVPVAVVLYILLSKFKNRRGIRYTNTTILGKIAPRQSEWMRHVAVACSIISLIVLGIAFAIPQAEDKAPRERATVVLVIDTSMSMKATDVEPNRIDAAKKVAADYVQQLPKTYNVSLVQLSGNPSMRIPPTTDRGMLRRAIDGLQLTDGTAIGEALSVAMDAVDRAPKGDGDDKIPASIVLLSDGSNHLGRSPISVAETAKARNVPIYTVAYGSSDGYVELDGRRTQVVPDVPLLADVAKISGGKAFKAEDTAGLKDAYERLQSEVGYVTVQTEVTARWAGLGLVFGVLAALAAALTASRTV